MVASAWSSWPSPYTYYNTAVCTVVSLIPRLYSAHSSRASVVGNAKGSYVYLQYINSSDTHNDVLRNKFVGNWETIVCGPTSHQPISHLADHDSYTHNLPHGARPFSLTLLHKLTLILLMAVMMSILHVGLGISKLPMYCTEKRETRPCKE